MAVASLKFDKGWKQYANATNPKRFLRALKKHVRKGTQRNAIVARKQVRQEIKAGIPPRNAELTARLKSGGGRKTTKPIVGTPGADLWNAIAWSVEDWNFAFVGVKRTSAEFNVADIVHNGRTIRVTEKMRHMFRVLAWASKSQTVAPHLEGRALELWEAGGRWKTKWKPLKASTKVIIIPKRPYIRFAFQDPGLKRTVKENWSRSVQNAITELAKK